MLREYGWRERYVSEQAGRNSRLDELQAAILRIKLRHLDGDNRRRRQLASEYAGRLANQPLRIPATRDQVEHVFHLYVVITGNRRSLTDHLRRNDIHVAIHYPVPVHLQPAYRGRLRTAESMRVTEDLSHEVLSLPVYPELESRQLEEIVRTLKYFVPSEETRA
jgi:dTDP-4-amino-4,6-dideoxygalactose transaminase